MNEKGDEYAATRAFELSLELDHPVDDVWRALTDAGELVRWFPFDAKVEPGLGGTVWLSWGDPWFFCTRIEVWRPGEHLRLIENRSDELAKDARIAMDFTLEGRGGATVLRMVHSGFGTGEEWDTEYDGISRGWAYELRCLRHYLDRHLGQSRHVAWLPQPTDVGRERAYATVFGPDALAAEGSVAGLAEGDRVVPVSPTPQAHTPSSRRRRGDPEIAEGLRQSSSSVCCKSALASSARSAGTRNTIAPARGL
jgi:uncharacterized protein YndB with AHSA1/START domain